jgi:7-cyano-7-deazaguanine synthase
MIKDFRDSRVRNRRSLLLFSGGFDSTFVALTLLAASSKVSALCLDYPRRPKSEISSSEEILDILEINDRFKARVDLEDFRDVQSRWLSPRHEGWIPYRNIVFFGLAAHYAYLSDSDLVAAGVRVWDTTAYNDATLSYLSRIERLLSFSGGDTTKRPLELYLPIIKSHDPILDFVREHSTALRVLERTWSCWRNGERPCGACAPCLTRARFLAVLNGVK